MTEIEGGWKTFHYKNGSPERRFIPLHPPKKRHCCSCAYYSKYGCRTDGAFLQPDTEACEKYTNRNEGKVKVYY